MILSIETSCDDTSVAIVNQEREVLSCVVASQDLVHQPFGGVVPEIASRNHSLHLLPLVEQALLKATASWDDIEAVAVTSRPGLVGSLIVGLVTGKTLALAKKKEFIGVHHIEGHIMAPFLKDKDYSGPDFYDQDFLALVISGGHTQLYQAEGFGSYTVLGETMDDAAGEAFDKFAKMLGLPYPGGVEVDRRAQKGDVTAFEFPRPLIKEEHYNFSFSGLKSAALRTIQSMTPEDLRQQEDDLCASYQAAIIDVLMNRVQRAVKKTGLKRLVVSGGVSANSALRAELEKWSEKEGIELAIPPLRYCTDNAAMIGLAGLLRIQKGDRSPQNLAPQPRAPL